MHLLSYLLFFLDNCGTFKQLLKLLYAEKYLREVN